MRKSRRRMIFQIGKPNFTIRLLQMHAVERGLSRKVSVCIREYLRNVHIIYFLFRCHPANQVVKGIDACHIINLVRIGLGLGHRVNRLCRPQPTLPKPLQVCIVPFIMTNIPPIFGTLSLPVFSSCICIKPKLFFKDFICNSPLCNKLLRSPLRQQPIL